MLKSALYIVPTPIGNLEDITLRAISVLKSATLIAAEDTRHSKILLDHLGIKPLKMISCHDHNEAERASIIIDEIQNGGIAALISDAGSPLINDPGYKLVLICAERGVDIVPLPGPCALITALEASALPTDKFLFSGFFPVKEKELRETFEKLQRADYTAVFYESPKRILSSMELAASLIPEHQISIGRELTKNFESFYRMKAKDLPDFLRADPDRTRGEFVVAIGADKQSKNLLPKEVVSALAELSECMPLKQAASVVSRLTGFKKNELYDLMLKQKAENDNCI